MTLLELLIVLSITTILLVAGIPGLHEYLLNKKISSSASTLFSDLRLARNEAVRRNIWTIACPGTVVDGCFQNSKWHQGWIVFADINGDRNLQAEEPLLRNTNALDNISALSSASRMQVRFFPGGTAPGSNTSIVFCDHRGHHNGQKIVISNSGRIRQSGLGKSDESRCPPL